MTPAAFDPAGLPLRDIHLPPPIGWWPPAPGWWALAALGAAGLLLLFWGWRRHRRDRLRRAARRRLTELRKAHAVSGDRARLAREASRLMRQLAISRYGRRRCARLTGQAWLAFLNEQAAGEPFSGELAEALLAAPYGAQSEFPAEALLSACESWTDTATRP